MVRILLPEAIRSFLRKAVVSVFRVRGSVLCEGDACVAKHMSGKSATSQAFAENQNQQIRLDRELVRANEAANVAFGSLCDEIAIVAKNGSEGG